MPRRSGGATTSTNTQGLCEGCNDAKETAGFRHHGVLDDEFGHTVEITTPTGHRHRSRPPPLPIPPNEVSPADLALGA